MIKLVTKGSVWLDKSEPNWEEKINLDSLDMLSATKGICGQLWSYYGREPNGSILGDSKLMKLGFYCENKEEALESNSLWTEEVLERKKINNE